MPKNRSSGRPPKALPEPHVLEELELECNFAQTFSSTRTEKSLGKMLQFLQFLQNTYEKRASRAPVLEQNWRVLRLRFRKSFSKHAFTLLLKAARSAAVEGLWWHLPLTFGREVRPSPSRADPRQMLRHRRRPPRRAQLKWVIFPDARYTY